MTGIHTMIQSLTGADLKEVRPLCWSFLYFFSLLCGYYILRPVRDEMAIEGGVQHLPWMMTATFATMLVATPLFGRVSRASGCCSRCMRFSQVISSDFFC